MGIKTTIGDIAKISQKIYQIKGEPKFNYPAHKWDVTNWYSNSNKATEILGWTAKTYFEEGLLKTTIWVKENLEVCALQSVNTKITCYKKRISASEEKTSRSDILILQNNNFRSND